jgi:hypothetical protein
MCDLFIIISYIYPDIWNTLLFWIKKVCSFDFDTIAGSHGRDRMVVGFTTTCVIYHHKSCEFESHSWQGVLKTTLYDINFVSYFRQIGGFFTHNLFLSNESFEKSPPKNVIGSLRPNILQYLFIYLYAFQMFVSRALSILNTQYEILKQYRAIAVLIA